MELINNDVFIWKHNILPLNLLQIEMCVIYHVSKVYLIPLFQHRLIVMIDLFGNIQEKERSWIICPFSQNGKATIVITGCLVLLNELHHKDNQRIDIKIALTAAKNPIEQGGDVAIPGAQTPTVSAPTNEKTPIEPTAEEKKNISDFLSSMGF